MRHACSAAIKQSTENGLETDNWCQVFNWHIWTEQTMIHFITDYTTEKNTFNQAAEWNEERTSREGREKRGKIHMK